MAELQFSPAKDRHLAQLADVLSHAFGFPRGDATPWFDRAGHDNIRVLRRGESVVGGLFRIPMGQFFGGRAVPTLGIAGVGVRPDARGAGLAVQMMRGALREARSAGVPLSTLYPASVALYRRAGYERAGARLRVEVDPRALSVPKVEGAVLGEALGIPDEARDLYRRFASKQTAFLDRGPYVWERIVAPRGKTTKTFTVRFGDELEGYIVLSHEVSGANTILTVADLAATSPRAARALLRLIADYRSLSVSAAWHGGLADPFVALLPERHHTIIVEEFFMIRVVEPALALASRGYPDEATGSLVLAIQDETLPENSGHYELSLEAGVARVERTKKPAEVTVSEHGLAALYAGHLAPAALSQVGMLDGSDTAKDRLATWFAGPPPSMRDAF